MTPNQHAILDLAIVLTSCLTQVCSYKWGWHSGAAFAFGDIASRLREGNMPVFSIAPDGQSITCHVCGFTSHNPNDVREKYCGYCKQFHADRAQQLGLKS